MSWFREEVLEYDHTEETISWFYTTTVRTVVPHLANRYVTEPQDSEGEQGGLS